MARILTVDFKGVESGGGLVRVPEGDYGLKLTSVKGKKGADSGKPYLDCQFEITQGAKRGIGKKIRHSISLQKQSLWNFRNVLEAMGKTVPSKAVKIDLDKLIGQECAGTLIDDAPYEGRIKSVITAFFPLEDLGKTSDSGDELEDGVEEEQEEESEELGGEEEEQEEEAPKKKPAAKKGKPAPAAKKGKKKEEEEEEGGLEEEEESAEESEDDLFA